MVGDAGVVTRGEVWWASTPAGERPVVVLTRDPVAERSGAVVVVACTRTVRGISSEMALGPDDGMPEPCVASFDHIHTLRRAALRRRITRLNDAKLREACAVLGVALGCRP